MNRKSLKHAAVGLGLWLLGSGCVALDASRGPEGGTWELPEDARVEGLTVTAIAPEHRGTDWEHCHDFTLTAPEVLTLLRGARVLDAHEAHYNMDWVLCSVTGRLRSDAEPGWDAHFEISATLAGRITQGGRTFHVMTEEDFQRSMLDDD